MAFFYSGTKLPLYKSLKLSLAKIYGIGYQRSSYICDLLGFGFGYQTFLMNNYFWECIIILMKKNYKTGKFLKDFTRQRLVMLHDAALIRARRMFLAQPVRGQRTHSNCRTPERLRPAPIHYISAKDERKKAFKTLSKKKNVRK